MILWLSSISGITLMDKLPRHTWAAGLTVGPLFAWLCWAIQRRNRLHIALATAANIELWILGPILAAHILGKLP